MADNRLNLIVEFLGIDKLSPAMKNIVGLGRSGKQAFADLASQGRKARGELGKMEGDLKALNKQLLEVRDRLAQGGAQTGMVLAERELKSAIEDTNTQIAEQKRLIEANAGAQQKAKNALRIDGKVANLQAKGSGMVSSGVEGLAWGAALAAPVYEMAKAAGEAESQENRLRVLGLDNTTIDTLETNARRAQVAGASYLDMMRYTVEAQGAFRESGQGTLAERVFGAKTMVPILAKMSMANKALGVEMGEDQEKYLLRFIEEAGGMNDPKRAAAIADGVFRALQSSGGNVQASDYQRFMAAAGTSGMKLSQRSLFADFEPLIGELHEGAGVGLMSAYQRVNGVGRVLKQPADEMRRLGLWAGGKNGLSQGNASLFGSDPVEFYRRVILPAYAKAGVQDAQRENALLFGRTGGQLFNQIDRQLPAIMRSRSAFAKTQGLDKAYQGAIGGFFGQQGQMTAAWKDFLVTAGSKGGLLQQLTNGLRAATGALRFLTQLGNDHPTVFKWIGTAVAWSLGLKLGLSAVKVVFGGLLGPVARLWGLWEKYKELGSVAAMFPTLARGLGIARTAMLAFDASMLLNPFVWIPAAIVAVGLLGYAVYANWAKIKGAFGSGIAWIKGKFMGLPTWMRSIGTMMMQGLLMALNPALLVARLLQVAKTGITAFKNFFGIKSPSRLMMQMGGHITEGLAHGVERGARRPMRAMARMTTGLAAAASFAAPAAHARAPAPITIHIHQQPGEDAHALAERVADVLERRQRGHRLSSYQDDF